LHSSPTVHWLAAVLSNGHGDAVRARTMTTNAYSTHFVKSSGLNAKAKFHHI